MLLSDVGGNHSKSKSERKNGGGRTLIMKNRLVNGGTASSITNNDIGYSSNYLSTKNGQAHKENTPLKGYSSKNIGSTILNSEERRKLFNTFMKEMNHSLVANSSQIGTN